MIVILFFLSIVWALRILSNVLSYVQLWYIKEYRLDRMIIHLRTAQGRRFLFIPPKRPPVTPKTVFLVVAGIFVLAQISLRLPFSFLVNLLIVDLLTFPVVSLLVLAVRTPTFIYHEWVIRRAIAKIRAHKKLLVIAITGSYGKTSTKEYLATILSSRFNVLKTQASKNSPIAIAETVLNLLSPQHQIFIVEMGAYKRGEIAKMCAMVRPQIGIVTAINAQHQDLFKNIKTTMQAKFELVKSVTGKQIVIMNADNRYTREMIEWALDNQKHVWTYSHNNRFVRGAQQRFFGKRIVSSFQDLTFTVAHGHQKFTITAPVLGQHQVSNILAAVAAGVASGMTLQEAARGAGGVRPFTKTLEPTIGVNGSTFINDTFNNNPDAARGAVDVLSKASGKKILVFQPMIELGSYAKSAHEEVGQFAARVCDEILLTNNNFYSWFMRGVARAGSAAQVWVLPPKQAADHIRLAVRSGDTVLFKGKESEHVFKLLTKT